MQPVRFAVFLHYKNKKFSSHCSVDFSLNHACQHDVCLWFAAETKRFRIGDVPNIRLHNVHLHLTSFV